MTPSSAPPQVHTTRATPCVPRRQAQRPRARQPPRTGRPCPTPNTPHPWPPDFPCGWPFAPWLPPVAVGSPTTPLPHPAPPRCPVHPCTHPLPGPPPPPLATCATTCAKDQRHDGGDGRHPRHVAQVQLQRQLYLERSGHPTPRMTTPSLKSWLRPHVCAAVPRRQRRRPPRAPRRAAPLYHATDPRCLRRRLVACRAPLCASLSPRLATKITTVTKIALAPSHPGRRPRRLRRAFLQDRTHTHPSLRLTLSRRWLPALCLPRLASPGVRACVQVSPRCTASRTAHGRRRQPAPPLP